MDQKTLITQLKQGDETAFRQLVEQYQSLVFNTILSMVQNAQDADDLSQEVFIEVYRSIASFREDAKISTWLYRIASNKSLEYIRKKKTKKRFAFVKSLFTSDDEPDIQPSDFVHPGVELENKERAEVLFRAIAKLSDNQRLAYTLHNIEDLSYKEIAEVMQVSLSSVESLLFRAKQNLRKLLEEFYKEDYE
ncbi:MAG: RNA polymerase sigma factor [Cytophagales bacterium]|nr:RNA polymerase sigma factor [Cytophagales bacterium]